MIEKHRIKGYWWKPEDPENVIGGIARYTPEEGIYLEAFSSFDTGMGNIETTPSDLEILHGITTEGRAATLRECTSISPRFRSTQYGSANPMDSSWNYLAIGRHFGNQIELDRIRVTYPLLAEWAQISGVSISGSFLEGDSPTVSAGDTFNINYEFPDSKSANINDFELKLLVNAEFKVGQSTGGANVEETTYFDLIPKDRMMSLEEGIEKINKIQDFLTLGIGKEVRPSKIIGRVENEKDKRKFDDVDIYFHSQYDFEVSDSAHPQKMNFTFDDIEDSFEQTVKSWFEKSDSLSSVYNLYFSSKYNNRMYIQTQLLTLTQAIESFHRKTLDDSYISDEEFEDLYLNLVNQIPEDLPEDFKQHLKHGPLKYANEYSLRRRLRDIIETYDDIFDEIDIISNAKISEVVNARNYLTHYDAEIGANTNSEIIWDHIQMLRAIIEGILLYQLNIPEEAIITRLNQRYAI